MELVKIYTIYHLKKVSELRFEIWSLQPAMIFPLNEGLWDIRIRNVKVQMRENT